MEINAFAKHQWEKFQQYVYSKIGERDKEKVVTIFNKYEHENYNETALEKVKNEINSLGYDFSVNDMLSQIGNEETNINDVINLLSDSKTKTEGAYRLAEYCLNKFHIITIRDNDEIYIYNNGVYEAEGKKCLVSFIQKDLELEELVTTHISNEFLGYIRRLTYKQLSSIEEPKDKICLENGILDLNTSEISPHNPEIIFFNKLPVHFVAGADCPKIKKFLSEVVSEDSIPIIQEGIGYCLLKSYPIHKAIMLVGSGANGKSTLINLLKAFLGQKNCSSIPLQQLENNRFAVSSLFGKLANLFADLPARALRETSYFKMLTGEDLISAEKKFQEHFSFTNYSKLIFSCNQIPKSPDDSDAFFRRWIIINFPNQFIGNADKKLSQKLTTKDELSGFLNFALEGLKRLLKQGDFSNSKSIIAVREEYIRQSDSVGAFVMDCILISPEDHVQKKEIYTAYCDYCRSKNYPIVPENTFHKELQAKIRIEDYRPSIDGRRPQCWKGIKVNVNPANDVKENSNLSDKNDANTNKIEKNLDKSDNPDSINSGCSDCGLKNDELVNGLCPLCKEGSK
nr:hypothetical protein [Candidatus Woesearchaeota archaeon]